MTTFRDKVLNGVRSISSVYITNAHGPGSFAIRMANNDAFPYGNMDEINRHQFMKLIHEMFKTIFVGCEHHLTGMPDFYWDDMEKFLLCNVVFKEELHDLDEELMDAASRFLNKRYLKADQLIRLSYDKFKMVEFVKDYVSNLTNLQTLIQSRYRARD